MKDRNRYSQHTFLFWLLLPALIAWFSFNYVKTVLFFQGSTQASEAYTESYKVVSSVEIEYPPLPVSDKGYITLWFDDAWLSQYLKGAAALKEYGFVGALAVPTVAVERENYMNWAQVRSLQDSGWEITNHSRVHDCNMQNWPREQIREELKLSTLALWDNEVTSEIFVSPCGVYSEALHGEVIKQFSAFRTVEPGHNDLNNLDIYNLKIRNIDLNTTIEDIKGWVDQTSTDKSWLIIVFHQLGNDANVSDSEETYSISDEMFKLLLEDVKSSGIPVVTPSQVLQSDIVNFEGQ